MEKSSIKSLLYLPIMLLHLLSDWLRTPKADVRHYAVKLVKKIYIIMADTFFDEISFEKSKKVLETLNVGLSMFISLILLLSNSYFLKNY